MAPERASTDQADRLNDDVVAEILFRLPSAAVLRSLAVCRSWRRVTTSPAFLAAHAHRRPLELILRAQGHGAVYAVPLATHDETRRRRLDLRWCDDGLGWLLGTCGGLLLFERRRRGDHLVCNPATRQCLVLPRTPSIRACGVYTHSASGEHRLLYLAADDDEDRQPGTRRTASHRVLTLGAADDEARRIGPPDAAIEICTQLAGPYVNHRGNLHWLRHPWVFDTDKILAFDAVSETFRRIPRPPLASNDRHLFLGEAHGNLALTAIFDGSMDLWVLEDYHGSDSSSWTRRLRVNLPLSMLPARLAMMNDDVLGQNVILLENDYVLALYHLTEKKVLKEIKLRAEDSDDDDTHWTSQLFRESLERHAFFDL